MKPLVLAVALALAAPLPLTAIAAAPATTKTTPAAPAWVARSNELAQILLQAQAPFQPEMTSFFGVPGYDDKVVDLRADNTGRYRAAMNKAREQLREKLQVERDPNLRQDLEIMIGAAERNIESSTLNEQHLMPWVDVPQTVFGGINGLLSDQVPEARRAKALDRLNAYLGKAPGTQPLATLARQRYEDKSGTPNLLQPTKI